MSALVWLDPDRLEFPPARSALSQPPGLLAAGGDLSPERLELAYRSGIFPWFEDGSPILWWSPDPRAVVRPGELHVSRSLRRRLNRGDYEITLDQAFDAVVAGCAAPREEDGGTWITDEMAHAYGRLHRLGIAHSVEVWMDGELAGGMYGVAVGRCFFGESMFSRRTDASKIAFVHLLGELGERGFPLFDCQMPNPHLQRLGVRSMRRAAFLAELRLLVDQASAPGPWTLHWQWPGPAAS